MGELRLKDDAVHYFCSNNRSTFRDASFRKMLLMLSASLLSYGVVFKRLGRVFKKKIIMVRSAVCHGTRNTLKPKEDLCRSRREGNASPAPM